jgi:hypothetical protein|nr:MAG TPA: voltage-gated sodium channel protein [Caudoviricetes sp.]
MTEPVIFVLAFIFSLFFLGFYYKLHYIPSKKDLKEHYDKELLIQKEQFNNEKDKLNTEIKSLTDSIKNLNEKIWELKEEKNNLNQKLSMLEVFEHINTYSGGKNGKYKR